MVDEDLLNQVKRAVAEREPDADIVLYGSRARGDATADSDWDFLVLVNGQVDERRKRAIRHRLRESTYLEPTTYQNNTFLPKC